MKKILLFSVIIFTISCASNRHRNFNSNVQPAEINEVLKIDLISYISLIETGNRGFHNDSVSQLAQFALTETLGTFRGRLRLPAEAVTDSLNRASLEIEIDYIITRAERDRHLRNISVPPFVESFLYENDQRFGLILVQSGFTRARGNFGGQVARSVGVGVLTAFLTGSAVIQAPVQASSTLYAIIIDNKEKNIAFYRSHTLQNEPTEQTTIARHFNEIFESFLERR